MRVKVFGKESCGKCISTKKKLHHLVGRWNLDGKVELVFFSLDTIDGLAEGAFNDVESVPVTIIENDTGVVARWDGVIPHSEALRAHLVEEADGAH